MEKFLPTHRSLQPRSRASLFALATLGSVLIAAAAQRSSTRLPTDSKSDIKMKSFVIIFRQGPRTLTESDLARRQQEVSTWAREQNAAGHKLEPRILASDVQRPGANPGSNAGFGEWPITALLFLEAGDLAEAATIAASHPGNHFGAMIEVRPWAPPVVPAAASAAR